MSSTSKLALLTICAFAVFGCGQTEVGTGDPTDENQNNNASSNQNNDSESSSFRAESEQLAAAQCDRIMDCCASGEHDFEDDDECNTASINLFGLLGDEVEDAYAHDRIDIDNDAIDSCEDSIKGLSCSQFDGSRHQREGLDGCRDVIVPLLAVGDSCNRDFECNNGYCDGDDEACVSLPSEGESCAGNRCASGLYCDNLSNECTELLDEGELCGEDRQCKSGYCVSEEDTDGIPEAYCEPRPPMCEG